MIVNDLGINSALSVKTLIDMRNQLVDLQRQLGTGKKADNYAGLGLGRGLTVGLRAQLSAMAGYRQTIDEVGVRLDLASASLSQIDKIARSAKSTVMQSQFALGAGNQTTDQKTTYLQFDQMLSVLNTSTGGFAACTLVTLSASRIGLRDCRAIREIVVSDPSAGRGLILPISCRD
jgi:flagellin-like hook-associated protein FlgL